MGITLRGPLPPLPKEIMPEITSGAIGTQSDSGRSKSPLAKKKRKKRNINASGGITCPEMSMDPRKKRRK